MTPNLYGVGKSFNALAIRQKIKPYRTREDLGISEDTEIVKNLDNIRVTALDRTLPPVNTKKEPLLEAHILNGASNGIRFEPYCVELMHLCLHDDETIEQIRKFLNYNNFSDISYI